MYACMQAGMHAGRQEDTSRSVVVAAAAVVILLRVCIFEID
jgi:hypothetical protein